MDQNEEAFCRLREELSRALMLLREINFGHLMRLTNDIERKISGNEHRTCAMPTVLGRSPSGATLPG